MPQRQITGTITARESASPIASVYVDVILAEMQPYGHTRALGRALTDAYGRYDLTVDLPDDVQLRGRNEATIHLNVHDNISHSTLSPSYELDNSSLVIDMAVAQDITLLNDWADFRAATLPVREQGWMANAREAPSPMQLQAFSNSLAAPNSALRDRPSAPILNRGGATALKKPCCDDCGDGRPPCSDRTDKGQGNSGIAMERDHSTAWANLSDGGWMRDAVETPGLDYGPIVAKSPNTQPDSQMRDLRHPIPWGRSWADQLDDLVTAFDQDPGPTDNPLQNGCNPHNLWYLDAAVGNDDFSGKTPDKPWKTLWRLHLLLYHLSEADGQTLKDGKSVGVNPGDEFVFAPGEYTNLVPDRPLQWFEKCLLAADVNAKDGSFAQCGAAGPGLTNYQASAFNEGVNWIPGKQFLFTFQATILKHVDGCNLPVIFRRGQAPGINGELLGTGEVIWRGVNDPKIYKAAGGALWPLVFASQEGAMHDVELQLSNIHFIGRGGGNSGLNPNWRAPNFMMIDSIGSLIMRDCHVSGSGDAPDGGLDWQEGKPLFDKPTRDAWEMYHTFQPVYGPATGNWINLRIAAVGQGDIDGCTFEAISNIVACGNAHPTWRFPANASYGEGVEMQKCANVKFKGCTFGSAGHFALQLRGCAGITVQDSTVWNRVHSGISGEDSTNCTFERNTFVLGGAWYDSARSGTNPDNIAMTTGGSGHIIAFNHFKPDPDCYHGGSDPTAEKYKLKGPAYLRDFAINIAGQQPEHCPLGFQPFCVNTQDFDKLFDAQRWDYGLGMYKAATKTDFPWFWKSAGKVQCADGKVPVSTPKISYLSARFQCDSSFAANIPGQAQKHCADSSSPGCVDIDGKKAAVIWFNPAKIAGTQLGAGAYRKVAYGVHYDAEHFGELAATERIAIFNNTIVDVAKTAIGMSDYPGKGCERTLRDILVFNNVILGQRTDPTKAFLENGFSPIYNKGSDTLYKEPLPYGLSNPRTVAGHGPILVDETVALLDIDAGGIFDGSSGIRIFCNAIGRSVQNLASQKMQDDDWTTENYDGDDGKGPANTRQVLRFMAEKFFGLLPGIKADLVDKLELPSWATAKFYYSWPVDGPSQAPTLFVKLGLPEDENFSTDWAVKLPSAFDYPLASYRWAAVNQLNGQSPSASLKSWSPLGGENTSIYLKDQILYAMDNGALNLSPLPTDWGGLLNAPWLPKLPMFSLKSTVGKTLPDAIDSAKFTHVVEYLNKKSTTDLFGYPLSPKSGFKGVIAI